MDFGFSIKASILSDTNYKLSCVFDSIHQRNQHSHDDDARMISIQPVYVQPSKWNPFRCFKTKSKVFAFNYSISFDEFR